MPVYAWAFLIGAIAGLRALTAPAVVSWAARLAWLHPEAPVTPQIFSALAIDELVNTKLPKTPSRKGPRGAPPARLWAHCVGRRSEHRADPSPAALWRARWAPWRGRWAGTRLEAG